MKKHFSLFLLFLLLIPSYISLLRPGFFPMQDDLQAFRIYQMDKCFMDFQIPCRWVPDAGYGYGYPLFNFYAPSVYYLGEIIHLVGFHFINSVKILFILGFIVGGFLMYKLTKEFFGNFSGIVAAILFSYAPYRAQQVYVRGAISEFWGVSLLPLLLWASYKIIKSENRKYFLTFSLGVFLLLVTHNLLPLIFFPTLALWIFFLLWSEKKYKKIKPVALSAIIGVLLSAFFILPLIIERKYIHSDTLLSGYFDYRRHFVDLKQMFLLNTWGYGSSVLGSGDELALSSGRVLLLGSLLGLVLSLKKFKKTQKISKLIITLSLIELAVLFMMHLKSSPIWELFNILHWLQFPWRLLSISILLLAFITAAGVNLSGKLKYIVGLLLIILAFVWHGSFFKPKYWFHINDSEKFSGESWEKQLTISIADYLPVFADFSPNVKAKELPEVLEGEVEFTSFEKGSNYQNGTLNVIEPSVIRLQLFDFPGMTVFVNGDKVVYTHNNCEDQDYCFGLISLSLDKTAKSFKAVLKNTLIRTLGNMISLSTALLLFYIYEKLYDKKLKKIFR